MEKSWMKVPFEALSEAIARNEELLAQGYDSRISSPSWTVYAGKLSARDKREIKKYRKLPKKERRAPEPVGNLLTIKEVKLLQKKHREYTFKRVKSTGEKCWIRMVPRAWSLPIFVMERARLSCGSGGSKMIDHFISSSDWPDLKQRAG